MKQILQNIRSGERTLASVPAPMVQAGEVLIANQASLVSAGTEKILMDLASKSLLGKARERPDHVRRVLEKIRNEGLMHTIRQVQKKLGEPMTMGYSSAGVVLACGEGIQNFKPGDRVASNGCHAEVVSVPANLCAQVPDSVEFEQACFAILGSIALQGVRLSKINLGETVLVIGLGLVGQLTVALLKGAGCRVIGTDLDAAKCELAEKLGADVASPGLCAAGVEDLTRGLGADAVIITASTKSNGPIELAAAAVRQKGRVVLVGVVGLELDRRPFFFKEAEFVVSCSYGPGRYDTNYEQRGHDYPAAYVRWTEQRNIQAVLDLMGDGKLDVSPLITHRIPIAEAERAYQIIDQASEPYLGMVLDYPGIEIEEASRRIEFKPAAQPAGKSSIGVLGAGNFARMVLLPAIEKCGRFHLKTICSAGGTSAAHTAQQTGFEAAVTDESMVFDDPSIDTIFSITQHHQHAEHVLRALKAGKNIFVEKPLCLTCEELDEIETLLRSLDNPPMVMVGFNRRFSPSAKLVKDFFRNTSAPLAVTFRFNAGAIPPDHWTQNDQAGGGRIVGEACHAIDLATYLTGSLPTRVFAESIGGENAPQITDDQCVITLRHANGSVSTIAYLSGGDKAFPKERVEVFGGGQVAVIDDFRTVTTCAGGKSNTQKLTQDKGHSGEIEALAQALTKAGEGPISWPELRSVTLASLLAVRSLREGYPLEIV